MAQPNVVNCSKIIVIGRRFFRASAQLDLCLHGKKSRYVMLTLCPPEPSDVGALRRRVKLGDQLGWTPALHEVLAQDCNPVVQIRDAAALEVTHERLWAVPDVDLARKARDADLGLVSVSTRKENERPRVPADTGAESTAAQQEHVGCRRAASPSAEAPNDLLHGKQLLFTADAAALASWLLSGDCPLGLSKADMCRGSGILDVAGGNGELSALLTMKGIRTTIVDPRPSAGALSRARRKQLRKDGFALPTVLRIAFEYPAGACHGKAVLDSAEEGKGSFDGRELFLEHLRTCSVIIGLHPDQATDAIVDFAVANRKPFVVVPCCVFGRQFPQRRYLHEETGELRPVDTREQLISYLSAKDHRIQQTVLPFKGANIALFASFRSDL